MKKVAIVDLVGEKAGNIYYCKMEVASMEEKIKKILYLMQYPPPIHGVSVMNNYVLFKLFLENGRKNFRFLKYYK